MIHHRIFKVVVDQYIISGEFEGRVVLVELGPKFLFSLHIVYLKCIGFLFSFRDHTYIFTG